MTPVPTRTVFHVGIDGASVRAELGVPDDGFLVVLVSKMVEPKGHEVLLRAAPEVLASFPATRFVIVGGDLDGAHHRRYAGRLRRLPAELGVDHAVIFTGYRGDVAQIMAAADIVTHCSTHPDPFPGTVLQGMSLGKVVIATNLGRCERADRDGVRRARPSGGPGRARERDPFTARRPRPARVDRSCGGRAGALDVHVRRLLSAALRRVRGPRIGGSRW